MSGAPGVDAISSVLALIQQYGLPMVLAVVFGAAVVGLARMLYRRQVDELKRAQDENERLRQEMHDLYADLQRYLVIGNATKQAIEDATDALKRHQ